MKKTVARALALIAPAVFAVTALGAAPASADELPEGWGAPQGQMGLVVITARQDGRLHGRLGNQHVTQVSTWDEEERVRGWVSDWWCPTGVTAPAPFDGDVETTCHLKGSFLFDQFGADTYRESWSPALRYLTFRSTGMRSWESLDGAPVPARRTDTFSLRLRAAGSSSLEVSDGDIPYSILTRTDARIVGGQFFGTRWLDMTSVEIEGDAIGLWSYYEPA